jgi:glucose/arabinose dehydrogenase
MVNEPPSFVGRTSKSVRAESERSTAFQAVRPTNARATHRLETRVTQRWALVMALVVLLCTPLATRADDESDYYRIVSIDTPKAQTESRSPNWKPAPEGLALEVSGLAVLDDDRLAVAIRKGEIWILDGVHDDPPDNVTYHRFASGLHEPLGLLWHDGAFYTAQRSELTRIEDTDGDNFADAYLTAASCWGVTGHYHEYAYGPKLDGEGNLWITLNTGLGLKGDQLQRTIHNPTLNVRQGRWRGWGMKLTPEGKLLPVCAGMRSPAGIGINADGDAFYTDQQGNWVGTNTLHHMREGAFFHHVDALASAGEPDSPLKEIAKVPNGLPFPDAVRAVPQLVPPAVWLPYKKVGQSPTDILLDESGGTFGPFAGQFFIGEFTQAGMNRVFLEKVDGQYQGACFGFRLGFASAVLRMAQGGDGSVFVGLTNRGWSSLGTASYGLQRLVWTGKVPFEIREMRAMPDGFELTFTKPLDPETAMPEALALSSYTYLYHSTYGSDEIQRRELEITGASLSDDGLRLRIVADGLRPLFVHELTAPGLRSIDGEPLLHPDAYYTLNRIPIP